MLPIFQKKEVLGEMEIIFPESASAYISDSIPKEIHGVLPETVCDLWFAMMFMGKLLYNFPGTGGTIAVQNAAVHFRNKFPSIPDDELGQVDLFPNVSLLGLFLEQELTLIDHRPDSGKIYRGVFFKKGDNYLVETDIAFGNEDYYHCAAIDAVLERERIKLGDKGSALVTAVGAYLSLMLENGTSNLAYNMQMAASSAMTAASKYPDVMAKIEALG